MWHLYNSAQGYTPVSFDCSMKTDIFFCRWKKTNPHTIIVFELLLKRKSNLRLNSPVCNLVCCWTCDNCLNLRSQYEHLYGFSPVCTRMCWTNWWLDEKVFKHCWHWWGLTSRPEPDVEPPEPLPPADTPILPPPLPPMPPWWPEAGPPKCIAAVFVIRYCKKEQKQDCFRNVFKVCIKAARS